jgi:glycosyltransferase involved in cell wall biosynthesis
MSITKGNRYLKERKIAEALKEYEKVTSDNPLYKQAQFNIKLLKEKNTLLDNLKDKKLEVSNQPLVSVIMPVFNVAPYLDASILSVLNQTYQNIEVIIVNDASTDNGINIINMFANLDKRIKVIDLEFNTLGGAGIPSNIGVDAATGDYIAYADSDDILDKYAIEKMVNLALKEDVEVVIADFSNFSDESRQVDVAYDKKSWSGLPVEKHFGISEYSSVFRLSPVPWRKLYKRSFLNEKNIRFPEGDYFYEDNPLHWFVLSQANSVALLDYVVAYHRMGREGQTMGSNNYKLVAMYSHVNSIRNFFNKNKISNTLLWKELLDYAYRCGWVIDRQDTEEIGNIVQKRYAQVSQKIVTDSKLSKDEILKLRSAYFTKIDNYNLSYEDKDLTVIIPVYNCGDLLEPTLDSLTKINLNIEVFMMDDGSTDNSKIVCERYVAKHKNFHLFSQNNKGAGVARNALIPLATGKYTYFLDADDTIDPHHLEEAVKHSMKHNFDLTIFKYRIHFYEKNEYRDMWNADQEVFEKLLNEHTQVNKQILASQLVNYPWNRIIKTTLLHNEIIFFGKTIVHNDIPYHWHSIISSKNIGVFNKSICNHRKFDNREQITNITDTRRMMVLEAYRYTNNVLRKYENFDSIFPQWEKFIKHILSWAEDRIPTELKEKYKNRKNEITKEFKKESK